MTPRVAVRNPLLRALKDQAEQSWPEECCGVLLGHAVGSVTHVTAFAPSRNVALGDRRRRYQLDAQMLGEMLLDGRSSAECVVGFYHSHPDGAAIPSNEDREAAWFDKLYMIIAVQPSQPAEVRVWSMEKGVREGEEHVPRWRLPHQEGAGAGSQPPSSTQSAFREIGPAGLVVPGGLAFGGSIAHGKRTSD
ncbi:MAG: M67 family metallopeptidase [bacterium]|nr:M67 family metallopeptidase [bacterium]